MSTLRTAKPLLQAVLSSGLAVLAFTTLLRFGVAAEPSLAAAVILAGLLNVGALASLNGETFPLTCGRPVGDLSS